MCGIVGYTGPKQADQILLKGLQVLEYRGYDSAGIAVQKSKEIKIVKKKGKVEQLVAECERQDTVGQCGIAHTRWATHGKPSDVNSHPHSDCSGAFALIHNGIIENYLPLKEELLQLGHKFKSDTDTEVIVHMIEDAYDGDLFKAVRQVVKRLQGAYALAVISSYEPGKIVVVRQETPLIIGLGEGEHILASDAAAIVDYTKKIWRLENGEMAVLTPDSARAYNILTGEEVQKHIYTIDWDISEAKMGGFDHFMRKEIEEQPQVIENTLRGRLQADGTICLPELEALKQALKDASRLQIVACGTSYHAGLVGKYLLEELIGIPVEVDVASEYRYRQPIINKGDVVMVISQSGETLDTLAALRLAKQRGAHVIGLVNVVSSSIATQCDGVIYLHAGPEIGVASTKAYVSQLVALVLFTLYVAQLKGKPVAELATVTAGLNALSQQAQEVLHMEGQIKGIAADMKSAEHCFFIGRLLDYVVSLEGSLKLKEISYIHSEAKAAGELKHGPLALITDGTPVIALATQHEVVEKTLSNIMEVQARGGVITLITDSQGKCDMAERPKYILELPQAPKWLMPILTIIPLQLLSYHASVMRGINPDKPRNLAKSVTVE